MSIATTDLTAVTNRAWFVFEIFKVSDPRVTDSYLISGQGTHSLRRVQALLAADPAAQVYLYTDQNDVVKQKVAKSDVDSLLSMFITKYGDVLKPNPVQDDFVPDDSAIISVPPAPVGEPTYGTRQTNGLNNEFDTG